MSISITSRNNTEVSVVNERKAIDVRKELAANDEVLNALSVPDRRILVASTRKQIADLTDAELTISVAKAFKFIALDLGYNIKDGELWQYTLTRISTALKAYYKTLTMSEVSLAFELYVMGELDKYLPTVKGVVNKNHYQQLSLMYVSNVLNAYEHRQADAVCRANEAAPKQEETPSEEYERDCRNYVKSKFAKAFLRYKYHGKMAFDGFDDMFLYDIANKLGYAEAVEASEVDKKKAYGIYIARANKGLRNKYEVYLVRKQGVESEHIAHIAYFEARKREVKRAFEAMVENEIIINKVLVYE